MWVHTLCFTSGGWNLYDYATQCLQLAEADHFPYPFVLVIMHCIFCSLMALVLRYCQPCLFPAAWSEPGRKIFQIFEGLGGIDGDCVFLFGGGGHEFNLIPLWRFESKHLNAQFVRVGVIAPMLHFVAKNGALAWKRVLGCVQLRMVFPFLGDGTMVTSTKGPGIHWESQRESPDIN